MSSLLKCCPFCGCDEIDLTTSYDPKWLWEGLATCTHCGAQGSINGGQDSEEEAIALTLKNWNEAGRPGWWHRNVTVRWNTLRHDWQTWRSR